MSTKARESEIMLGLLEAVAAGGKHSQRHLAAELGIALGLVNIYLKRCVKKGLIKVAHAPARRYAYYLTPQGLAEKSRLMAEYLSWSLTLFRRARAACAATVAEARGRGWRRIGIVGDGDLAEVVAMCAAEFDLEVVRVAARSDSDTAVVSFADAAAVVDGVVITDFYRTADDYAAAVATFGAGRVLVPSLVAGLVGVCPAAAKSDLFEAGAGALGEVEREHASVRHD